MSAPKRTNMTSPTGTLGRSLATAAAVLALGAAACGDSEPSGSPVAPPGERGSEASPAGSPARAGAQPVRAAGEQDDRAARRDGAGDRSGRRGKNDPARRGERRANQDRRTREERILRPGARGDRVLALQRALRELGYWLGRPDGTYGVLTEQAVLAFQGVEGIGRDGAAGPETFGALRSAKRPSPRSTRGDLIEIDEGRGALFVVRDGAARWVFHTSTGTDEPYSHPSGETLAADTPNGRWTVSWAFDGWRESDLGEMWRPRYFHADGIAIHGFESVPAYPASHGCARVSIAAMNLIWERDLAPLGSTVWVY